MDTDFLFSTTNALFLATIACCWFFLSNAPKLTRYSVLFYGLSLAIEAMGFEGFGVARIARSLCVTVAGVLMIVWAYRVTNRPGAGRPPTPDTLDRPAN
jgi:hypothetical protein